jgi:dephospho-CoA kinase
MLDASIRVHHLTKNQIDLRPRLQRLVQQAKLNKEKEKMELEEQRTKEKKQEAHKRWIQQRNTILALNKLAQRISEFNGRENP